VAWSDFKVKVLKDQWALGKTAEEIADLINDVCIYDVPTTRNAVVGKIHRLGLSGRATPPKPSKNHIYVDVSAIKETSISHSIKDGITIVIETGEEPARIICPPCWRLRWLSDFVFSQKLNDEIFQPMLDDVQFEYNEAIARNRLKKAKWITIRGHLSFVSMLFALLPTIIAKQSGEVWQVLSGRK